LLISSLLTNRIIRVIEEEKRKACLADFQIRELHDNHRINRIFKFFLFGPFIQEQFRLIMDICYYEIFSTLIKAHSVKRLPLQLVFLDVLTVVVCVFLCCG